MADRFEDERGIIQDLLGPVDAVTEIFTRAGYVRGNHVHHKTTQWVYLVSGRMLVSHGGKGERIFGTGERFAEDPGIPHAWLAIEDTWVLVFTKGPRSGEAYETDTERLPREEWLLEAALCAACHQPGTQDRPLSALVKGHRAHARCATPDVIAPLPGHWRTIAEM